jgi:hypothetical protein
VQAASALASASVSAATSNSYNTLQNTFISLSLSLVVFCQLLAYGGIIRLLALHISYFNAEEL